MTATKAQIKANVKYEKKAYYIIRLKIKKSKEPMIRYAAQQKSTSVNGFINHAIDFFLKNEMHYDIENYLDESGKKISFEKPAASPTSPDEKSENKKLET